MSWHCFLFFAGWGSWISYKRSVKWRWEITVLLLTGTFKKKINIISNCLLSAHSMPVTKLGPGQRVKKTQILPIWIGSFDHNWSKTQPKMAWANTQLSHSHNFTVEGTGWLVFQWCHQIPASLFCLLALPFNMLILFFICLDFIWQREKGYKQGECRER